MSQEFKSLSQLLKQNQSDLLNLLNNPNPNNNLNNNPLIKKNQKNNQLQSQEQEKDLSKRVQLHLKNPELIKLGTNLNFHSMTDSSHSTTNFGEQQALLRL